MAEREAELRTAWSVFLGGFRWDHAVTLTTRHPYTTTALSAELHNGFIRRLARMAQRRVPWFAAYELTHVGRPHLHVLLGGTVALTTKQLEGAWKAGHTRMTRLCNQDDAIRYVVKELGREPDNFEVSGTWTRKAG